MGLPRGNLFRLAHEGMVRLQLFFPGSHGKPRVDGRRPSSMNIFIGRSDAP
jgi:hypothetical protein